MGDDTPGNAVRRELLQDGALMRVTIPVTSAETGQRLPGAIIITAYRHSGELTMCLRQWRH